MQQVIQNIKTGELTVQELLEPLAGPGEVLIANTASIVSAGTERMIMDLAKKSLLGKARERPDHVRRVIQKMKTEGVFETIRQVQLNEPMTMGYQEAWQMADAWQTLHYLVRVDRERIKSISKSGGALVEWLRKSGGLTRVNSLVQLGRDREAANGVVGLLSVCLSVIRFCVHYPGYRRLCSSRTGNGQRGKQVQYAFSPYIGLARRHD